MKFIMYVILFMFKTKKSLQAVDVNMKILKIKNTSKIC